MNIENPQTMISTKKKLLAALLVFVTTAAWSLNGLQPVTKISSKEALTPQTTQVAFNPQVNGQVIDGDLSSVDWPSMLGQDVTVTGNLVVVDTFDLVRRGRVVVARERLYIPTSSVDPNDADPNATYFKGGSNVAKVIAAQKFNEDATFTIDDRSSKQNVFPPALFPGLGKEHPTVRVGSVIKGVSGKLVKERNKLLLVSDQPLQWTPAPRPQRPDVGEADVTVSSFNVLNYFTTIDNGANKARGADSDSEMKRQEAKLVSAISALKTDVIGLMEIENNLDA